MEKVRVVVPVYEVSPVEIASDSEIEEVGLVERAFLYYPISKQSAVAAEPPA